jgi:hypothetical protein
MGLYPVDCQSCGKQFMWFSGLKHQMCPKCLEWNKEIEMSDSISNDTSKVLLSNDTEIQAAAEPMVDEEIYRAPTDIRRAVEAAGKALSKIRGEG